jgi:hypothetical protein
MGNVLIRVVILLQFIFPILATALTTMGLPRSAPLGSLNRIDPQAAAQVEFIVAKPVVDFTARTITFKVQIQPADPAMKAFIYLQPEGREAAFYPLSMSADGQAAYVLDTQTTPLRVFTQVHYSFRVDQASGEESASQDYTVEYADTRFAWKSITDSTFEIYYYDRDIDFGQTALNTANRGLEEAVKLVPARLDGPIRVYVYRDPRDLQKAQQGLQPWAAGHAAPDLRMVLVSIPTGPDQRLELERQLPHELVHVLQYQALGERARDLPAWLLEGSASVVEFYQNPEYASVLRTSAESDRLLSFETLCTAFPRDASGAFLAYAQSQSFVRYLRDRFGSSGLNTLYQKYADGMSCSAGFEAAFQTTFPEAEYHWRLEALGLNAAALVLRNLLPYLIFFFIVFGAASVSMLFAARKRRSETGQ